MADSNTFTLSRAEAAAVSYALEGDLEDLEYQISLLRGQADQRDQAAAYTRVAEGLHAIAHRLELEFAIRSGGGWWGADSPAYLDLSARFDPEVGCPDEFALASSAVPALVELLPWLFQEIELGRQEEDEHVHPDDRAIYEERESAPAVRV